MTIVIVTFNSVHCLPALGNALTQFPHVIVIDNGSDDNCADQTPAHLPQAQVLALPANLGFGAANNRALAQVQTPFALLLNPDCEITPQAVVQLLHTAHQWPDAAMVAPQLLQANGQPEVNYRWPHLLWHSRGPAVTEGPACVGFVCGAARQQQRKLLWQTALALVLRVLLPSPRHVARMCGRVFGLIHLGVVKHERLPYLWHQP